MTRVTHRVKAVNASDISLVSRQLEIESRSTVRSTISGQLPRILLIQVTTLCLVTTSATWQMALTRLPGKVPRKAHVFPLERCREP